MASNQSGSRKTSHETHRNRLELNIRHRPNESLLQKFNMKEEQKLMHLEI